MDKLKKKKLAMIYENDDFIVTETFSGYRLFTSDPFGAEHILKPDVGVAELGAAVLDCLSRSRFIIPEYYYKNSNGGWMHPEAIIVPENIFDQTTREQNYQAWISKLQKQFGYKSKRALFKNMKSCDAEICDGTLTVKPTNHERLEGWGAEGISQEDHVVLPENSSSQEIGKGVRLALSRCI